MTSGVGGNCIARLLAFAVLIGCAGGATQGAPPGRSLFQRAALFGRSFASGSNAVATADTTPLTGPRLRIIATADFHGAIEPRPDNTGAIRGGAAALAGAIASAQRNCPPPDCAAIILDGGDMFQGTPESNLAYGRPVVDIFNTIGYSAAALGNHEFDWGQDTLRALMAAAHYAILGANVRYADGRAVEWIRKDTIVQRGRYKVGVIGISTRQTPITTRASNVSGLRFDDPAPIVDSLTAALRARGAQAVVVIAHAGATCAASGDCQGEILDLAARLTQHIDAIVAGHSHTRVSTVVNGIPIVEARSSGLALATVDIPMAPAPWTTQRVITELYTDSVAPSPAVKAIADRALAAVAQVVARPEANIAQAMPSGGQSALGNLIADAMRVVGRGDIGIMNTGGVRHGLPAGSVTFGQLFEVQPFGDVLYRVRVRGGDLREYFARALRRGSPNFLVGGARIVYHTSPTMALDSLIVGDQPLDDRVVYTVVVNDFMLTGGDNLGFADAPVTTEPADLVDLDALIAYLRSLPQPVVPPTGSRIVNRSR